MFGTYLKAFQVASREKKFKNFKIFEDFCRSRVIDDGTERILKHFRLFPVKKIFYKNFRFLKFFRRSGVIDLLKNDSVVFFHI